MKALITKTITIAVIISLCSCANAGSKTFVFDKNKIPEPVFDSEPYLVDFYWLAWQQAYDHMLYSEGIPQSPYMDEVSRLDWIWIWDTCFMVHFCKYAPDVLPGIESFENFYGPMYDNQPSVFKIHHLDNPPLFAWIEYEYFRFTGDKSRLRRILQEKRYLQKHYYYLEYEYSKVVPPFANMERHFQRLPKGYKWSGNPSGMDNSPRGRGDYDNMLWIDALSQQALSAFYIVKLAEAIGDNDTAAEFQKRYDELKHLTNKYYWDETDGIYYDIRIEGKNEHVKVKTPASYWAMLAELSSKEQAERMAEHIKNPNVFGGEIPLPSVSRDDPDYEPKGFYWRGGVWLPLSYMTTKALEKYGHLELADESAYKLLKHMYRTYKEYCPHTIWECYNPEKPRPSTKKDNISVTRKDFCGWSALGPISLFIENVLGFHKVDAIERRVEWRKYRPGRHGIKRLRFGSVVTDIIAEGNTIEVTSNEPYTLVVNGEEFKIKAGKQKIVD